MSRSWCRWWAFKKHKESLWIFKRVLKSFSVYLCNCCNNRQHVVYWSCHYCSYLNYVVSDDNQRMSEEDWCYTYLMRWELKFYSDSMMRELEVKVSVCVLVRWDMRRIQNVIEHSIDQMKEMPSTVFSVVRKCHLYSLHHDSYDKRLQFHFQNYFICNK